MKRVVARRSVLVAEEVRAEMANEHADNLREIASIYGLGVPEATRDAIRAAAAEIERLEKIVQELVAIRRGRMRNEGRDGPPSIGLRQDLVDYDRLAEKAEGRSPGGRF